MPAPVSATECEVTALAEIRPQLAKKVAARYGVPKVYSTFEEMLAREKLDALVASQPFTRHGVLVPELAKAGLPLFTEKPIAGSIEAGEKILQALKKNKTWLMVGYHKRSRSRDRLRRSRWIERFKQSSRVKSERVRYTSGIVIPPGDWIAEGSQRLDPFRRADGKSRAGSAAVGHG